MIYYSRICGDVYFFTAQSRASSQPIPVQPNTHDATRMRIASALPFLVWAAIYAGASITSSNNIAATIYLITKIVCASNTVYFPYVARSPNSSSIRSNWLYFAIRSVRDIEPVFICPAFVATAKSAIVVSSVSPLR